MLLTPAGPGQHSHCSHSTMKPGSLEEAWPGNHGTSPAISRGGSVPVTIHIVLSTHRLVTSSQGISASPLATPGVTRLPAPAGYGKASFNNLC